MRTMLLRSSGCSTCAETDVDEGHDWDIFNVNEGLWNPTYCFFFLNNVCMRQFHWHFRCRGWAGLAGGRYPPGGSKCLQICWRVCLGLKCVFYWKCCLTSLTKAVVLCSVSVQNQNSGLLSWLQSYLHSTHWKPAISHSFHVLLLLCQSLTVYMVFSSFLSDGLQKLNDRR